MLVDHGSQMKGDAASGPDEAAPLACTEHAWPRTARQKDASFLTPKAGPRDVGQLSPPSTEDVPLP